MGTSASSDRSRSNGVVDDFPIFHYSMDYLTANAAPLGEIQVQNGAFTPTLQKPEGFRVKRSPFPKYY
jgi:hypothetical protein